MSADEDRTNTELPLGCFSVVIAAFLTGVIVGSIYLYFEVSARWNLG